MVVLESQTPEHGAEQIAVGGSFDHLVETALAELPDRYRRVVELVDIEGLSYRDAAEALAVPVGTVMSRLHRARRRIRDRLIAGGLVPAGSRQRGPRCLRRLRHRRQTHLDPAMLSCETVVEVVQLYLDGAADEMTSEQGEPPSRHVPSLRARG